MNLLIPSLLIVLLRTSLLLAVVAIAVRGLLWMARPRSPRLHRLAWGIVLAQTLALAPLSFEIPCLSTSDGTSLAHFGPVTAPVSNRGTWEMPDVLALAAPRKGSDESMVAEGTAAPRVVTDNDSVLSSDAHGTRAASALPTRQGVATVLLAVWLAGMVTCGAVTMIGYARFATGLRSAVVAPQSWQEPWKRMLDHHGIRQPIPLRVHATAGPMLCRLPGGYCVVVPGGAWRKFSPSQRIAILRHELAHFLRADIWTSLAARSLALLQWFNPLAWYAVRRFEETSEWACDEWLARSEPSEVPAYAQALLELIEPTSGPIGSTAARGAPLATRLRRLLIDRLSSDSRVKQGLLIVLILALGSAGILRLRLVAKEPNAEPAETGIEAGASDDPNQQLHDEITRLRDRIDAGDSEPVARLKELFDTEPGRLAIQGRVSAVEEALRERARVEAIPKYFRHYFDEDPPGQLTLKSGQDAYRQQVLEATAIFQQDVEAMKPVVAEIARQLAADDEGGRLLQRFLAHEAAPTMLYVEQLRQRLRPDEALLQETLGEWLVPDSQGRFVVRAAQRAQSEQILNHSARMLQGVALLRDELRDWSAEFVESDDLNREVKQMLAEPEHDAYVAVDELDNDEGSVHDRVDQYFDYLENATRDTADGLALEQEVRGEVEQALAQYRREKSLALKLAGPLRILAARIREDGELEGRWREFLLSDVGAAWVARHIGGEGGGENPEAAVRELVGQWLHDPGDGRLRIKEEAAEQVSQFVQGAFQNYRQIRRKSRPLDDQVRRIADDELRQAFATLGGKFIVARSIQSAIGRQHFDGYSAWVAERFEETDRGLVLRDGWIDEVQGLIEEIQNIERELKKDDFQAAEDGK